VGSSRLSTIRPSARKKRAVGVRSRARVVRHDHDGLAGLIDGAGAEAEDHRRSTWSRGCRSARRRRSPRAARSSPAHRRPAVAGRRQLARIVGEPVTQTDGVDDRVDPCLSGSRPARSSGSRMFSSAVSVGTRLNDWKTNPTRSRRSAVRALSSSEVRSVSPMNTRPAVIESSPARQCISVTCRSRTGPMIAVNRPRSSSTETSSRATTCVLPSPKILVTPTARAAAEVVVGAALVTSATLSRQGGPIHPDFPRSRPGYVPYGAHLIACVRRVRRDVRPSPRETWRELFLDCSAGAASFVTVARARARAHTPSTRPTRCRGRPCRRRARRPHARQHDRGAVSGPVRLDWFG